MTESGEVKTEAELPANKWAGVLGVVLPQSNISLGTPAAAGAVLPLGSPD